MVAEWSHVFQHAMRKILGEFSVRVGMTFVLPNGSAEKWRTVCERGFFDRFLCNLYRYIEGCFLKLKIRKNHPN